MGNNNFKINLKISKPISVNTSILRTNIPENLKEDGYEIIANTATNIDFNNYGAPLFRVRGSSSSKLREGSFILVEDNGSTLVILNFHIPFLLWLTAVVVLLGMGFLWGWGVFFIIGLFIVGFISEIFQQRDNAKRLINAVAKIRSQSEQ